LALPLALLILDMSIVNKAEVSIKVFEGHVIFFERFEDIKPCDEMFMHELFMIKPTYKGYFVTT
jgi:hypothetical protein